MEYEILQAIPVLPAVMAGSALWNAYQGYRSGQRADRAQKSSDEIAREQLNLQRQQAELDLPFKKDLYNALRARMGQGKFQAMAPTGMTYSNPYRNVRQVQPPANYQEALRNPNVAMQNMNVGQALARKAPVNQQAAQTVKLPPLQGQQPLAG